MVVAAMSFAAGCALFRPAGVEMSTQAVPPPTAGGRIHAVLVNGGGRRAQNYLSHRTHLEKVLALLRIAGVPESQIAVFASDGRAPAPDLATRRSASETAERLLGGTAFHGRLVQPTEYVNTELAGVEMRPATPAALDRWMATEGAKLGPGDVLFLYVTDHGTRGKEGARHNAITLWGRDHSLTVDQLEAWLARLPSGVRVVTLMSQCFSGAFARLAAPEGGLPDGRVCGYFASTESRPAYGCYPEARGADDIGHSVRMLEATATRGWLADGHRHALAADFTPDVPLRSSDVQLELLLRRAAARESRPFETLTDEMLVEAFALPGRYEPEIRQLDRIAAAFGFAGTRSLADTSQRLQQISRIADPLAQWSDAWTAARGDLARANVGRFLDARPSWRDRLDPRELDARDVAARVKTGEQLVAELATWTAADAGQTDARLELLTERSDECDALAYRMEVREAALERLRAQLIRLAGLRWLDSRAGRDEQEAFTALFACEDLVLPVQEGEPPAARDALPSWDDDLDRARVVLPAWMGIQFEPAKPELRRQLGLDAGAVSVRWVYPDSPAARAGLVPGDIIVGPPGAPFTEPAQIREWVMLREIGREVAIEILHNQVRGVRTLLPGEHPGRFPDLPRAPRPGMQAPALAADAQRGSLPATLADGRRRLLFFWATWCVPCKAALPEMLEWAGESDVEVIALTDEPADRVAAFLESWEDAFPETVARDRGRTTFLSYGVSGTPTFVLIGGDGRVLAVQTGYRAGKGLDLPD